MTLAKCKLFLFNIVFMVFVLKLIVLKMDYNKLHPGKNNIQIRTHNVQGI